MFTLRRLLTTVKDKDEPEDGLGALYKIKCFDYLACVTDRQNRRYRRTIPGFRDASGCNAGYDYQATYIGETDRSLITRLNEHFDLDYAPLMSRLTDRSLA